MQKVVIHALRDFTVTSYGNGWAYLIEDKRDGREFFEQGDDAAAFRAELEAWELVNPNAPLSSYLDNWIQDRS